MGEIHNDHLIDCEVAMVGALLWSGEPADTIAAAVPPDAFADRRISAGWTWALSQPAALVDCAGFARASGLSLAWLAQTAAHRPTWQLWQSDAAEVVRLANCRRLSGIAAELVTQAAAVDSDPLTVAEAHGRALSEMAKGARAGNAWTIRELLPAVIDYIQALHLRSSDAAGIPTGFDELDRVSPLRPGELTILAARTGIGKSALAVNVAVNMARCGWPCGVVSLEMSAHALAKRVLQSEARACIAEVGHDGKLADYGRLTGAVPQVATLPLVICQPGRLTCSGLRRLARQLHATHGVKALVVDYLQLILPDQRSNSRNRENEVAEASSTAKGIAMDLGVPVLMLAQLNRQAEGDRPKLSHLRDSGAIEQDADVIWLLDRDRGDVEGVTSLTVAKNRDGDAGQVVPLRFVAKETRFEPAGKAGAAPRQAKAWTAPSKDGESWA